MATTTAQRLPEELERERTNEQRYFYPMARADLLFVFETYDLTEVDKPYHVPVVPKSLTIHRNSYKEADSWQITLDAKDFNMSPETIRAGSCEIRLFQMDSLYEFRTGLTVLEDNILLDQSQGVPPTIVGIFDEAGVEYSDQGKTVTISGTDYTGLFIAKPWPKDRRISGGLPLDQTLRKIVEEVPGATNLRIKVEPENQSMPIIGKADGRTNSKRLKTTGDNYWDIMYELAVRHGKIIFVRGLDIVLTNPQTYEEGRTELRKVVWGENLLNLQMSRKIGRQRAPTIEVSSYDAKQRKTLVVRYPTRAQALALGSARATVQTLKNGKKKVTVDEEVQQVNLTGITDKKILEEAAKARFNLLSRAEQTVRIETRNLRDSDGKNFLDLQTGDSVIIDFKPGSLDLLETKDFPERVAALVELGYNPQVADIVARSVEKAAFFKKPMRVREATYEWDVETGVSISAELQNYVIIDRNQRKA